MDSRADVITTGREAAAPHIGRPLPRLEDERLLRGRGRYTDDFKLPGQVHAAFVRAPFAHAGIRSIDVSGAEAAPDVLAVLTGRDYLADGLTGIAHIPDPADAIRHETRAFSTAMRPVADLPHLPLAIDTVRHLGEAVAVVVAETAAQAQDAAELVEVDYEERPALTSALDAVAPDAAPILPGMPDNRAVEAWFGDREGTEAALAGSAHIVEHAFVNQRVANAQMEPRSAIGAFDAATGTYTLISGSQGAARQRDTLAHALGIEPGRVHVVCPDVGGGFGPRTNLYPEQAAVAWAAGRIGRPVRWTSTRAEAFLTDFQGRDQVNLSRLGLDAEGRILGLAVELIGNVGAHTVSYVPMANGYRVLTTVYDVPAASVHVQGVVTNTVPTTPYRGAGRPEATFAMERLLDIAARRLGLDRIEIRRRNLVPRSRLPYRNAMGLTYDSGDFAANMERVLAMADWAGFPARRAAAEARGRLAGIGIGNYIESPVGIPHERIELTVTPEGVVEVVSGTQSTGQGHETTFAQVLADRLGVAPADIRLVTGDTARVRSGGGTHSDRTMRLGGALLVRASGEVIEQARRVSAALLGVEPAAVDFRDGLFRAEATNRSLGILDVAAAIANDPDLPEPLQRPLYAEASFTGRIPAYPTGAAVCEVEIDPETGVVEIVRYTSLDDVGQPINPLILHGQVHGGIAQGVGQALCESVVTEPGTGQVLTGSFMDYAVPRADLVPSFDVALTEDSTDGQANPLRVKGGGESGITPATAATINAIVDALTPLGVEHIDMPATPARVWEAIRKARKGRA